MQWREWPRHENTKKMGGFIISKEKVNTKFKMLKKKGVSCLAVLLATRLWVASNGETGSLLLAASACLHIHVCVCWRDRLLDSEGRGADRPQRRRRGAQQGEGVWAPKCHRSEMGRRSNPSIFNVSLEASIRIMQGLFKKECLNFEQCQN